MITIIITIAAIYAASIILTMLAVSNFKRALRKIRRAKLMDEVATILLAYDYSQILVMHHKGQRYFIIPEHLLDPKTVKFLNAKINEWINKMVEKALEVEK